MRSDTQSISLAGRLPEAYAFLAAPENLPRWAVGFCRSIRRESEGRWIVETASGHVPVRLVTNPECGTIDFHTEIAPGLEVVAYSRVLQRGEGTEYVFTQFQAAETPDTVFEHQVAALGEELRVLQGIFRARIACVA